MNMARQKKRCLIIGDPVEHSLSPRMHNAGYHALAIDDQFLFERQRVSREELRHFIASLRSSTIRGAACTMPHKESLLKFVDYVDPIAARIGAINTLVCEDGLLKGYNTDWLGVVNPLKDKTPLKGKKILILGAGGAARAAIVGLIESGAEVTITNRTADKAIALSQQFAIEVLPWELRSNLQDWDIFVNTTSLGMHPDESETPLPRAKFRAEQIVFETIYFPRETLLLKTARAAGCKTIEGLEMLLHQGLAQFEIFTGHEAPVEAMRIALLHNPD